MSNYRVLICAARTGSVVDELLPLGDPSWETEINQKGSWGCDIRLGVAPNFTDNVLTYVRSGAYFWVIAYGDTPIQGGMPGSATFDQKTHTLSVSGSGIGGLFDNRVVRTPNATPATVTASANNFTLSGITQRRVIRELFVQSLGDSDSGAQLPFNVDDAATETGTTTRTYAGFDLATVWKRAVDETDNIGGSDMILRPYFFYPPTGFAVGFAVKLGNPLLGDPALPAVWELGSAFGTVDVDMDVSVPRPHRVWSKGSGDGGAAVVGYAENTAALQALGVPYADYVDTTHNDVVIKATVDGYAAQILKDYSGPIETWTATVRIDGKNDRGVQISPELGSWVEGDSPLFRMTNHPIIPDGSYRRRIIGMSNGDNGTVKLKIQPTPPA